MDYVIIRNMALMIISCLGKDAAVTSLSRVLMWYLARVPALSLTEIRRFVLLPDFQLSGRFFKAGCASCFARPVAPLSLLPQVWPFHVAQSSQSFELGLPIWAQCLAPELLP